MIFKIMIPIEKDRFSIILKRKRVTHAKRKEIAAEAKRLAETKMDFSDSGNLSVRIAKAFLMTADDVELEDLQDADIAKITRCDVQNKTIEGEGTKDPSPEALIHQFIYAKHPKVNAIVHMHSPVFLNDKNVLDAGIALTPPFYDFATLEMADLVNDTLGNKTFVVISGHGALAVGGDLKESVDRMIKKYHQLR